MSVFDGSGKISFGAKGKGKKTGSEASKIARVAFGTPEYKDRKKITLSEFKKYAKKLGATSFTKQKYEDQPVPVYTIKFKNEKQSKDFIKFVQTSENFGSGTASGDKNTVFLAEYWDVE